MRKKLAYSLLILFIVWSCDEFLEQEPGTQISISEQLGSYKGIREAMSGNYTMLSQHMMNEVDAVYADACGGNISFSPNLSNNSKGLVTSIYKRIENSYNFSDDKDESEFKSSYADCYKIINGCNLLIENVDAVEDASDGQKQQIKAECYSMRAFSHFLLLRNYAQNYTSTADASHKGIVYNTKTQKIGVDFPARESVKRCYELVMQDFETALQLFTETNTLDGTNYSLLTATSTKALMARAVLYANNWQRAYDLANDVIAESGIDLMPQGDYVDQWKEPNVAVSEIVFELSIHYDRDGELSTTSSVSGDFGYRSAMDYESYVASGDLLNLFEPSDVRGKNMFIEAPLETLVGEDKEELPYYFTRKFQDNPGYPVIRMSEIYLIRAEAAARLNQSEQALNDLNVIQERANATLTLETDDLLEAIFIERRKELCFEGHLLYDIARFNKNVERNEGCVSTVCNLSYPSNFFVLPIPERNIKLNSNLEQNEGY